jgi:hypothetical protein
VTVRALKIRCQGWHSSWIGEILDARGTVASVSYNFITGFRFA